MGFAGKDARDSVLKDLFISTSSIYQSMFARSYEKPVSPGYARWGETEKAKSSRIANAPGPAHANSIIPATFHIIQFLGWKHDIVKQQQPKQRGSGNLQTFIDELVTDDPSLAGRIKYGMLGAEEETNTEKSAREQE